MSMPQPDSSPSTPVHAGTVTLLDCDGGEIGTFPIVAWEADTMTVQYFPIIIIRETTVPEDDSPSFVSDLIASTRLAADMSLPTHEDDTAYEVLMRRTDYMRVNLGDVI